MTSRLMFHPSDSQFAFAPNFKDVPLSTEQPIGDALAIIYKAKKRAVQEDQKRNFINVVENFVGATKIQSLRQLPDEKWNNLRLPLMARVYLKHLMKQSVSLTHLELLECEFNQGKPIDWSSYDDMLVNVVNMGFQKNQALEALVVCRGKMQDALEFLLIQTPVQKKKERDSARRQQGMFVPPSQHHTVLAAQKEARKELEQYDDFTGRELKEEIERVKNLVEESRRETNVLESEIEDKRRAHQKQLYHEYMKGLLCNQHITAVELQAQKKYMKQREIDIAIHKQVLSDLGFTLEQFDGMKDFQTTATNKECVVCLDPERNHLILPCLHCCLCEDCADDYGDLDPDEAQCPTCRAPIEDIKKVLFAGEGGAAATGEN